jgi:hypothetical protein
VDGFVGFESHSQKKSGKIVINIKKIYRGKLQENK